MELSGGDWSRFERKMAEDTQHNVRPEGPNYICSWNHMKNSSNIDVIYFISAKDFNKVDLDMLY